MHVGMMYRLLTVHMTGYIMLFSTSQAGSYTGIPKRLTADPSTGVIATPVCDRHRSTKDDRMNSYAKLAYSNML